MINKCLDSSFSVAAFCTPQLAASAARNHQNGLIISAPVLAAGSGLAGCSSGGEMNKYLETINCAPVDPDK